MKKKDETIINFITSNSGKVKTMQNHVGKYGFRVVQKTLPLIEPQEKNTEAIAISKAMQAFKVLKQPVVVEDSSFHIQELNGFPGPYIKYILETIGVRGILLLTKYLKNRACYFKSVLAYVDSNGIPRTFIQNGDVGTLARTVDNTQNDEAWSDLWRIFIPSGYTKTLTALSKYDRVMLWKKWEKESVFTQFATWLDEATHPQLQHSGRLLSSDFNFPISREKIAIRPRPQREHKLIVYDRKTKKILHYPFEDIGGLLPKHTMIVVNNSKVVKAVLRKKLEDGTYLHVMYPSHIDLNEVYMLCPWKPAIREKIHVNGGVYIVEEIPIANRDIRIGKIIPDNQEIKNLPDFLEQHGSLPIPIYINSERLPDIRDNHDYQNCYAKVPGSIESPTAGLHFYPKLIKSLKKQKFDFVELTLHIGYGTWKSFKTTYIDEHDMDSEEIIVSEQSLKKLIKAKKNNQPILGVGTSSIRTLESIADEIIDGNVSKNGIHRETSLFIYPGYKPRIVDMMLTNFAYPRTPIMAMAAAFAGLDPLKRIFREALDRNYLFYTYGDSILII